VHVHDREDETVFVLEGHGIFWAGDQRWQLTSGETAFLPRGVPHTHLFSSDTAEVITVCNPARMEEFFRAAGWDLSNPQPQEWAVDVEAIRSAAQACGQRVLGPPLAAGDEMPAAYLGGEDPQHSVEVGPPELVGMISPVECENRLTQI